MLHHLIAVWFGWVEQGGYLGIIALMAMESSILPVPSEVVIPPAAYLAAQGKLSLWGVIAAGAFGSWLGSALTYWVCLGLGRIVVVRWGRFFLVSEAKLQRAEHFVHRYEAGGVFFARLLPVIRHLISIPAGIVRMNFGVFSAMTSIGALIWCSVLAWFGLQVYHNNPDLINRPEDMMHEIKSHSLPIILFVALFCVLYFLAMRLTAPKAKDAA